MAKAPENELFSMEDKKKLESKQHEKYVIYFSTVLTRARYICFNDSLIIKVLKYKNILRCVMKTCNKCQFMKLNSF